MLQPLIQTCFRIDDVDVRALANRVPTPFYAYSAALIRQRIGALTTALRGLDAHVCYAVKANSNLAILRLMADAGLGADIVSVGELTRSLRAGIPAERIVFSGVGKTETEIAAALDAGIFKFNVESSDELRILGLLAHERNVTAHAAARINPDVDARTHGKISTGKAENKFGVSLGEARRWFDTARDLAHVRLDGLHVHVGSQILSLEPFRLALERVAGLWRDLAAAGHTIETIDVGGGLGVRYRADRDRPLELADYVQVVRGALGDFPGRLLFEPGRYLVADAGMLLTRVIRVKHGRTRSFLVVDAAMNDLMRPSLYDAWHEVIPVHSDVRSLVRYDIVGPVCESGDTFAIARDLPACVPGDLLMIAGTGAYGASMASTYNSRPLLAEVLVDRSQFALIRRRQTIEELMQNELLPPEWQVP